MQSFQKPAPYTLKSLIEKDVEEYKNIIMSTISLRGKIKEMSENLKKGGTLALPDIKTLRNDISGGLRSDQEAELVGEDKSPAIKKLRILFEKHRRKLYEKIDEAIGNDSKKEFSKISRNLGTHGYSLLDKKDKERWQKMEKGPYRAENFSSYLKKKYVDEIIDKEMKEVEESLEKEYDKTRTAILNLEGIIETKGREWAKNSIKELESLEKSLTKKIKLLNNSFIKIIDFFLGFKKDAEKDLKRVETELRTIRGKLSKYEKNDESIDEELSNNENLDDAEDDDKLNPSSLSI